MTKEQYADLNATMEAVEAQLDALRAGKLFQLR